MSGILRPLREFGGGSGVRSPGGGQLPVFDGLYGWWDESGLVGGATPTAWNDRSGNSRNFTLTNCLSRTVGGREAVDFDGLTSRGEGAWTLPSASDFTFFLVYNPDIVPLAVRSWLLSCTDNCSLEIGSISHRISSINGVSLATTNPTAGEQTISVARRRASSSLLRRFSSISSAEATGGAGSPVALAANTFLGIRGAGLSLPFNGTISEVLIYSIGLSDSQTEQTYQYLIRKHT